MKHLKALLEDMRAFNLDTQEELDLDALADINLDSLIGDEDEESEGNPEELDFNNDLVNTSLDDYDDEANEFGLAADGDTFDNDTFDSDLDLSDSADDFDLEGGPDSSGDLGVIDLDSPLTGQDIDDVETIDGEDQEELDLGEPEDTNFQGEIRTVKGANLVYKRKSHDGNYDELWIYNVGNDIKRETQIRRAILAGTDIDPGKQESQDGSQRADTTTTGNVQFLSIVGLPQ